MVLDEKKIKREAKQILDKFASALSKVDKEAKGIELGVDREDFERTEGDGDEGRCEGFKKQMLENAPEHDDDFIVVEKGSWK